MALMSSSSSRGLAALGCLALLVAAASATQYKVGGDGGWAVPGAAAEPYNTWAEKTSFQIGDQLLFVYPKDKDSVLLVEPADYNACNTSSYDKRFDDGSTAVDLDRAGAFFFISGVEANCRANEKLIVMVAAPNATAPAPSQTPPSSSPAPSATNGTAAGAGGQAPRPSSPNAPASGAGGKNSTARGTPPAAGGNSKNDAGLTAAGLAGAFATCIGYAMLAV